MSNRPVEQFGMGGPVEVPGLDRMSSSREGLSRNFPLLLQWKYPDGTSNRVTIQRAEDFEKTFGCTFEDFYERALDLGDSEG